MDIHFSLNGSHFWPTGTSANEGYPALPGVVYPRRPRWVVAEVHAQGEDLGGRSVVSTVLRSATVAPTMATS